MQYRFLFQTTVLYLVLLSSVYGQDTPVVIQAESGIIGGDFRIVDTLGARAVFVKTNVINSYYPGNANRVITYQITFPDSGTYDLYARVLVGKNNWDDDSYFYPNGFGVKDPIINSDWIRANGLAVLGYSNSLDVVYGAGTAANGIWKWINFSRYALDMPPVSFRVELDSLTRTFQIGGRENGLYIDKLVFGRSGLYFTVCNLNRGEAGSLLPPGETPLGPPIAEGQSKFLGCAWDYEQAPYFAGYWNQLTPGNAGKWGSVEYTRDIMNWTVLDSAYRVTRKYHMPIKEHTLIWGAQQPPWIGGLDSASQRQEIEEWFSALANRYDTIEYIDVVNEPIHNAPNGMIPWGTTIPNVNYAKALGGAGTTGWDWVITSFRLARQYFPDSKLILNEYSVINNTATTQKYVEIINLLKAENLIDGIGEQAHAFTTYGVSATTLKNNLDLLAATGIPLYLTELDIDGQTDLAQLQEYQRIFPVFWEHPAVEGITFWGSRYPVWRQEQGANLITNDDRERPAIIWLKAYVNDTLTLTQSIEISSAGYIDSIITGDKLLMSALVLPANTTIPNVTWSVTPSNSATIDSYGMLTSKTAGKVTVKAAAWDGSGVTGTMDITILNRMIQTITVTTGNNKDSVNVGDTIQITAIILPENATDPSFSWSLTPEGLADISPGGRLIAINPGIVTVIAAADDGSGVTGTLDITITEKNTTAINQQRSEPIIVYPNPVVNGDLTIRGIGNIDQIDLFDLIGNKVAMFRNNNEHSIRVHADVSPGIYILRLSEGSRAVYMIITAN
jgi:endo-1,4-beta-xylanase